MTVYASPPVGEQAPEPEVTFDSVGPCVSTSSGSTWHSAGLSNSLVMGLLFVGTVGAPVQIVQRASVLAPEIVSSTRTRPAGLLDRPGSVSIVPSVKAREAAALTEASAELRWIHEASGLTWEQLGRVFGVSRRAVHMWATGARMNAANAEALFALAELLRGAPSDAVDSRRSWLLRPDTEGRSPLDRFRDKRRADVQINRPVVRAGETLGSTSEPPQAIEK